MYSRAAMVVVSSNHYQSLIYLCVNETTKAIDWLVGGEPVVLYVAQLGSCSSIGGWVAGLAELFEGGWLSCDTVVHVDDLLSCYILLAGKASRSLIVIHMSCDASCN